jgi:hypothetical protein
MTFYELLCFIEHAMRMSHVYQPVMLRTLLDAAEVVDLIESLGYPHQIVGPGRSLGPVEFPPNRTARLSRVGRSQRGKDPGCLK